MAVMTDADRIAVWKEWMEAESAAGRPVTCLKAQARAFLDAADQWVSDNSASYNSAIPQPARGALTTQQKVAGLVIVLKRRFLSGV